MRPLSDLQIADAKRNDPPAAHRARKFVGDTERLVEDLTATFDALESCLESSPHDRAEILTLFRNFKKRAMDLHGQAVSAFQDIEAGR